MTDRDNYADSIRQDRGGDKPAPVITPEERECLKLAACFMDQRMHHTDAATIRALATRLG